MSKQEEKKKNLVPLGKDMNPLTFISEYRMSYIFFTIDLFYFFDFTFYRS